MLSVGYSPPRVQANNRLPVRGKEVLMLRENSTRQVAPIIAEAKSNVKQCNRQGLSSLWQYQPLCVLARQDKRGVANMLAILDGQNPANVQNFDYLAAFGKVLVCRRQSCCQVIGECNNVLYLII